MSNYSKRGDIEDVRAELAAVLMSESSQVDAACDAGCLSSPGSAYQDAPSSPGFSQTMPATAYLFGEGRRRSSGSLGSVGTDSPGSVQSVGSDGKPRRKSFQALFENIKGKMGLSPKKGSTKRKEGSTTHEEGKDDRSSCSGEEEEEDSSSEEEESSSSSEEESSDASSDDSSSSCSDYDSSDEVVLCKMLFNGEIRAQTIAIDHYSLSRFRKRLLKREYKGRLDDLFTMGYRDVEGDQIAIVSNRDFKLALRSAYKHQQRDEKRGDSPTSLRLTLEQTATDNENKSGTGSQEFNRNTALSASSRNATPSEGSKFVWQKGTLLGKGAYGKVFKAFNLHFGNEFAVKQVNQHRESTTNKKKKEAAKRRAEIQSLGNEIEMLKQLKHPNIVSYIGTETTKRHLFVFMEYASGGSIGQALKKWGALCENVVRRYTAQIIEGLVYLHERDIAHRDIKPSNILIHDGVVKLADFGTARAQSKTELEIGGSPGKESFTKGHVGTSIYMSPEVMMAEGEKFDLKKTDVWSLGCSIVEMISGTPPWPSPAVAVYNVCVKNDAPVPEEGSLSDEGESFLEMCFKRDWRDRAQAEELSRHGFTKAHDDNPEFLRTSTAGNLHEQVSGVDTETFLSVAGTLNEFASSDADEESKEESNSTYGAGRAGQSEATLPSNSSLSISEWI